MFARASALLRPRLRLIAAAGTAAASTALAHCHGSHPDADRIAKLEERLAKFEHYYNVQQTTGQGDAVFAWSVELTEAFPDEARPFEKVRRHVSMAACPQASMAACPAIRPSC